MTHREGFIALQVPASETVKKNCRFTIGISGFRDLGDETDYKPLPPRLTRHEGPLVKEGAELPTSGRFLNSLGKAPAVGSCGKDLLNDIPNERTSTFTTASGETTIFASRRSARRSLFFHSRQERSSPCEGGARRALPRTDYAGKVTVLSLRSSTGKCLNTRHVAPDGIGGFLLHRRRATEAMTDAELDTRSPSY